jgi:hypothetical protein
MANKPIFIGGMQRSGTSLLRAIIGSHPDVAIFEWDLPLWTKYYHHFKKLDVNAVPVCSELLKEIFADPKMTACHVAIDREAVENRLKTEKNITCGLVFQHLLEEYAGALNRSRWGLKTPGNEYHAETILDFYPDAKFIQTVRDPRDVAVSFQNAKGGSWNYHPGIHIANWRRSVKIAEQLANRYSDRFLAIRYEDLVLDPAKTTRSVCQMLNLTYSDELINALGHLGWKGDNSSFDDIGSDKTQSQISSAAIGRYHKQLDPYLIFRYQQKLKTELIHWQYQLKPFRTYLRWGYAIKSLVSKSRHFISSSRRYRVTH